MKTQSRQHKVVVAETTGFINVKGVGRGRERSRDEAAVTGQRKVRGLQQRPT